MNIKETKKRIIQAGHKAVEELIKVAKEAIVDSDDDISADRLKNAAATKKLAIFDAFEILQRIQEEEDIINEKPKEIKEEKSFKGFAGEDQFKNIWGTEDGFFEKLLETGKHTATKLPSSVVDLGTKIGQSYGSTAKSNLETLNFIKNFLNPKKKAQY